MSIRKIILDTDPGGDDCLALLWLQSLVQQGVAELVAVTTVDGNVAAERTFSNASQLLGLGGLPQIEVARGVPLDRSTIAHAAHIHGDDGMGNLSHTLPAPTHDYQTARFADEVLIDRLRADPGAVTIVAIAPLTNLAAAEKKCPGILKQAREIVVMGGAFCCPGNITAQAEFNVWFDPEAAQCVFASRPDLVVVSLDVTQRLIFTPEMAEAATRTNPTSALSTFLVALCEFMIGTAASHRETIAPGFLVHDAATLGYLFYPETLLFRRSNVQIETSGEWTRGQTVIDARRSPKPDANAWIATQVDEAAFFSSLVEDLKVLIRLRAAQMDI